MTAGVLCVLGESADEWAGAFASAGFELEVASAANAVRALESREVELFACTRVPGWEALIACADAAGVASMLLGPRPSSAGWRSDLPPHLIRVETPAEVAEAAARAWQRRSAAAPAQLAEHLQSVALVNDFGQRIARQTDVARVVAESIGRARDLCEADGASVLLVDPATGELYFDTLEGPSSKAIRRLRLRRDQGVAGKIAQTASALLVQDVSREPTFDPRADQVSGFQTGSIAGVPLLVGGDVIGVMEVVRSAGGPPLELADLRRIELLAPHVAIAVHNAQISAALRQTQQEVLAANVALERRVVERTEQIARAKTEWERTFDAIQEPIAVLDDFVVRRANRAFAARANVPIVGVPGRKCHELLAGRDTPCEGCPLMARSSSGLAGEVTLRAGTFRFSGFRVGGEGPVVAHYRDVTHERELEVRLRETERLAAVGQLASGAAHEINNPLGFVMSNLQSLKDVLRDLEGPFDAVGEAVGPVLDEAQEMIRESLDGARRVAEIVRGLRELARLRIGAAEPTSVNASVTRAIRSELGDRAGVELELGEDAMAAVDPVQLDHALVQILRNARQAGEGPITVRTRVVEGEAQIEVQDRGPGIRPEHRGRIFEPFFTTRGIGKGVGLGLTAAYGIVSQHGGRIDVESEVGVGSTFRVTLPQAECRDDEHCAHA